MTIYNIMTKNDTRIANIIIKNSILDELKNQPEYSKSLMDITKGSLMDLSENLIFELDSDLRLEECLRDAKKFGCKIAVIWIEGNWIKDSRWETELLDRVKQWDAAGKWLCAGHILSRKNRTPEFHGQCIVINLEYHRVLYMKMDKGDTYPTFSMSEEHLHDDYTPIQLIPSYEDQEIDDDIPTFDDQTRTFDIFRFPIKIALKHGFFVHNFDYDLRELKDTVYPEDDIEDFKTLLWQVIPEHNIPDIIRYCDLILEEDKRSTFEKLFDKKYTYEIVKDTSTSIKDEFVNIGAQVAVLRSRGYVSNLDFITKNIDTIKKVVWYDDNKYTLEFFEYMINNWNGKDFMNFYNKDYMVNKFDKNDDQFLEGSFKVEEEKCIDIDSDIMEKIKNLDHTFTQFSPMNGNNPIRSLLGVSFGKIEDTYSEYENIFVNFENIWTVDYTRSIQRSAAKLYKEYYKLIADLEYDFPTVYVTGYNPSGHLYQNFNTRLL